MGCFCFAVRVICPFHEFLPSKAVLLCYFQRIVLGCEVMKRDEVTKKIMKAREKAKGPRIDLEKLQKRQDKIRREIVDWPIIKSLWLEGVSNQELCEKFNILPATLSGRIQREQWRNVPLKYEQFSQKALNQKSLAIVDNIWRERKEKMRETEYKIAEKALDAASQMTGDQLLTKAKAVETMATMGRRSVGLDSDEHGSNAVNISVLSESFVVQAPAPQKSQEKVIEIVSTETTNGV
jgi:hypothetical protein